MHIRFIFKCNQSFQACFKDIFMKIFSYKSEVALATVTIESQSNYFHKMLPSAFSLLIGMCNGLVLSCIYQNATHHWFYPWGTGIQKYVLKQVE